MTGMAFEKPFQVSWSHLDGNGHMANTSYVLMAIDCRFDYFASQGFPPAEFARHRVGPVVRNDSIDYFRELHHLDTVRVNLLLAGLAPDARRARHLAGRLVRSRGAKAHCTTGGARRGDARTRKDSGLRGAAVQPQAVGSLRASRAAWLVRCGQTVLSIGQGVPIKR
jgi:acyl-CoA thioesterase FadM